MTAAINISKPTTLTLNPEPIFTKKRIAIIAIVAALLTIFTGLGGILFVIIYISYLKIKSNATIKSPSKKLERLNQELKKQVLESLMKTLSIATLEELENLISNYDENDNFKTLINDTITELVRNKNSDGNYENICHEIAPGIYLGQKEAFFSIHPDYYETIGKLKKIPDGQRDNFKSQPDFQRVISILEPGQSLSDGNKVYNLNEPGVMPVAPSCETEFTLPEGVQRITFGVEDADGFKNLKRNFQEGFAFIDQSRLNEENILIHCIAGANRSATFTIAYLSDRLELPPQLVYLYVKSIRTCASPHQPFLEGVYKYFSSEEEGNDRLIQESD